MYLLNTIFLIIGIFVLAIGVLAFFIPGFSRIINAPGGPRMKAMIAIIVGAVFLVLAIFIEMPLDGV